MTCPLQNMFSSAPICLGNEWGNGDVEESLDTSNQVKQIALVAFVSFLAVGFAYTSRQYGFKTLAIRWGSCARQYLADSFRKAQIQYHLPRWEAYLGVIQQEIVTKINAPDSQKIKTWEEKGQGMLALREFMACVEVAVMVNIQEIFEQYIRDRGTLLELGCGLLDEKGKSSLSRLAPESYHRRIQYSDRFPPSSNKKRSYIQLDVSALTTKLKENSQDHILACCVLDCIARDVLPTVADQIHQVLKPNGRIIVLSDLLFSLSPLVKKHCSDDTIVIPYFDEHQLGIKILSLEVLKQRAVDFGEVFSSFVEKLSDLPPKKRFELLYRMSGCDQSLSNFLGNVCAPEHYQFIEHKESFIGELTKNFEDHGGFKILECGYREKEVYMEGHVVDQKGFTCNYIGADLRKTKLMVPKTSSEIPPGYLALGSTFFVFVAEKIS